jgi:hypothetical protein
VWQIVADKDTLLEGQRTKIKKIENTSSMFTHFFDHEASSMFRHFLDHKASGRDLYEADLRGQLARSELARGEFAKGQPA